MKNKKAVKRVLIIAGAVLAVAGAALFVVNFIRIFRIADFDFSGIFTAVAVLCAGLIPVSIGLLMHAKDIRETKRGVSSFLKALGMFWLIGGGVNIIAIIMISILFGDWACGA